MDYLIVSLPWGGLDGNGKDGEYCNAFLLEFSKRQSTALDKYSIDGINKEWEKKAIKRRGFFHEVISWGRCGCDPSDPYPDELPWVCGIERTD